MLCLHFKLSCNFILLIKSDQLLEMIARVDFEKAAHWEF